MGSAAFAISMERGACLQRQGCEETKILVFKLTGTLGFHLGLHNLTLDVERDPPKHRHQFFWLYLMCLSLTPCMSPLRVCLSRACVYVLSPLCVYVPACVCLGVPPCACHYRVCPPNVYMPTMCMSPPCVFSFMCMLLRIYLPQYVCPLRVYVPAVYVSPCVGPSECIIPRYVCSSVCMSSSCVGPSECMFLCMYVPQYVCLLRVQLPPSVCSSVSIYALSVCMPPPCMSCRVYVPPSVYYSRMYVCSSYVCSSYICSSVCMSSVCMYALCVCIHSTRQDFRFCKYACSLGSAKNLKLLRYLVRPPS